MSLTRKIRTIKNQQQEIKNIMNKESITPQNAAKLVALTKSLKRKGVDDIEYVSGESAPLFSKEIPSTSSRLPNIRYLPSLTRSAPRKKEEVCKYFCYQGVPGRVDPGGMNTSGVFWLPGCAAQADGKCHRLHPGEPNYATAVARAMKHKQPHRFTRSKTGTSASASTRGKSGVRGKTLPVKR